MTMRISFILFFLTLFNSVKAGKDAKVILHDGAYYDAIWVSDEGDTVYLTNFGPYVNVNTLTISPDSNFFFFRYKEKGESYRLVVHDFNTGKKIAETIPGFGGVFEWNPANNIVHHWGCGTNCSNLQVYDINLKVVFFTLSSGGFEFSADNTFVAQRSMAGDRIWVFDLTKIGGQGETVGFVHKIDFELNWDIYGFKGNDWLVFNDNFIKSLYIKACAFYPVLPDTIGQYYSRRFEE